MRVWVWNNDGNYELSDRPPVEGAKIRAVADISIEFDPPEGIKYLMPLDGEVKTFWFHEELWGVDKESPTYNKEFWKQLQRALGD